MHILASMHIIMCELVYYVCRYYYSSMHIMHTSSYTPRMHNNTLTLLEYCDLYRCSHLNGNFLFGLGFSITSLLAYTSYSHTTIAISIIYEPTQWTKNESITVSPKRAQASWPPMVDSSKAHHQTSAKQHDFSHFVQNMETCQ